MSEYSERLCVVCGCGDVDLEPHPEFGGALLCRHCWPVHDSGRLDSPPERWREHDERDDRIGELESEVARLREQVAEEKTTTDRLRLDAAWFQARTDAAEYTTEQLREENARLRGLLGEVEWIDASWLAGECPICVRQRVLGHAPDCRLAAALEEKDHGRA